MSEDEKLKEEEVKKKRQHDHVCRRSPNEYKHLTTFG